MKDQESYEELKTERDALAEDLSTTLGLWRQGRVGAGEAVLLLGGLLLCVMFWLCIATAVLVATVFIRVIRLIKAEPRVIGVVIYLIVGAWLVCSLMFGVGNGLSRIPAGF